MVAILPDVLLPPVCVGWKSAVLRGSVLDVD
jgi:hypothetical protein